MKRLHPLTLSISLSLLLCLATGCSKTEEEMHQPDSEKYVYVSENIREGSDGSPKNFSVTEDHLYFLRPENTSNAIYRIPLSDIDEETEFSESEAILSLPDILASLPEDAPTAYDFAAILDYTTDSEQNVYCLAALYKGSVNPTVISGILYKQSPEGRLSYCTALPNLQAPSSSADLMAADSDGRVFVLLGSSILTVDEKGAIGASITLENDFAPDPNIVVRLLAGGEGCVYYTVENYLNYTRNTYIIPKDGSSQAVKASQLSGSLSMGLHESSHGLLVQSEDDRLYCYDQKTDSLLEILTWGDSNLSGNDIQSVTQLTGDSLLVFSRTSNQEVLLLLTKTPLSRLPQTEQIILVSFSPDKELRQCVVGFNRTNPQYHVSIETYGASLSGEGENAAAYALLDAGLISEDGPDILDLSSLGFGQYVDSDILEDLYSYMNQDPVINQENYPDNLLDGYTIDGELLCIPKSFYFRPLWAIGSRTLSVKDWTLPEIMALTEKYPDAPLFDPPGCDSESILDALCIPYCLEYFVNWETKEANFDSDEFRHMLTWIKAQAGKPVSGNETGLVTNGWLYTFIDYFSTAWRYEDDAIPRGYPSPDGEGRFTAVTCNALGILSNSEHKEGAWEFLRYFLSGSDCESGFPARMDLLEELACEAITPRYYLDENGNRLKDSEGNDWILPKGNIYIDGEPLEFFALEQPQADAIMDAIAKIDFSPRTSAENAIIEIVAQDAKDFFQGRKTPEQVSAVIQSRVMTLLQENDLK